MAKKRVFVEADVRFTPVAWGQTKVLVGTTAGGGADRSYVAITEYLPGMWHPRQQDWHLSSRRRGPAMTHAREAGDVA